MPNVVRLPVCAKSTPEDERVVEDFDYSDFCTLLEGGAAMSVHRMNGMTMLHFPRAVLIDNGGHCTCISTPGTSMELYIRAALAALDRNTAAA